MKKGMNGWTFDPDLPIAKVAQRVADAGFDTFEPVLGNAGALRIDSDEQTLRDAGKTIRSAGLEVSALATGLFWQESCAATDPEERERAMEIAVAMLDRARWIGAPTILMIPAVVGRASDPVPRIAYADALAGAARALHTLGFEAERRGVSIAVENVWNRFLLSPVEMRELIDRVNSPWVGVYFDVGNVLPFGYPQDWIETLGQRIKRVHVKDFKLDVGTKAGFCPPGDGDVNWPAVMAALQAIHYEGPLVYEGPGDPNDIAARIDRACGTA